VRGRIRTIPRWSFLLTITCAGVQVPLLGQVRSESASVAIVATLHESIGVQVRTFPPAPLLLEPPDEPAEVVNVNLTWRFRLGQSVGVRPTLEAKGESYSLLVPSGFVNLESIPAAVAPLSFQPTSAFRIYLFSPVTERDQLLTGTASLLIVVPRCAHSDSCTLAISIAVL
jgi:hypothetical protein